MKAVNGRRRDNNTSMRSCILAFLQTNEKIIIRTERQITNLAYGSPVNVELWTVNDKVDWTTKKVTKLVDGGLQLFVFEQEL